MSFHSTSTCCRSAVGEQGQLGDALLGPGEDALEQLRRWPTMRAMVAALEEVGGVLQRALQALRGLGEGEVRSNSGRCGSPAPRRRSDSPGRRERRAAGRGWSTSITWKSGAAAEVAHGLELLHQLLEGHVLVRVGAQRRLAHALRAARGRTGCPSSRVRSTSVLTKKPMRPCSSARARPAMGEPTLMSSWPE